MKRLFSLFLILTVCLIPLQANGLDNYYVESNGIVVEFSNDGTLAMLKHIKRGEQFNSWYVYQVDIEPDGSMNLTGLGEVKDDLRGNTFLDIEKPADITLTGIGTDHAAMSGKFNSPMRVTNGGGFNYEQWQIARSLNDYNKYPEQYSADSVANLQKNAYALVNSYKEVVDLRSRDSLQLKTTYETKQKSGNAWLCVLCIIPFIIGFILYQINIDGTVSDYLSFLKWIALNQILGLLLSGVSIFAFNTYWWVIVLAVLAILGIQITNLFSVMHLKDVVVERMRQKFPIWPAIIFGVIASMCIYGVIGGIAVLIVPGVHIEGPIGEMVLGLVLSMAILVAVGLWYRNRLAKNVPVMKEHFLSVAAITVFGVLAFFAFSIFIISWFIFKGTGKVFLNESESTPEMSLGRADDVTHSCSRCGNLGTSSCPHFREEGSPVSTCSSWIPD